MIANLFLGLTVAASAPTVPTFNKDVAPILWKHCASCHRAGEIGPMPLMTYKDAAKRADFLAEVTHDRQMPPWKAEAGYGKFRDEHRLTDAELKTFADWAKAGAPEGDAKDLPAQPKFPEGWPLGEPDWWTAGTARLRELEPSLGRVGRRDTDRTGAFGGR